MSTTLSKRLAEECDFIISHESIGKYRKGTRTPSPDFIMHIVNLLQCSADELITSNSKIVKVKQIPVIGTTSCGGANLKLSIEDGRKANFSSDDFNENIFCLVANGDCMSPDIDNEDEIFIDPTCEVQHGDIVHHKIDGESSIKVFTIDKEAHIIQFIPYTQNENFSIKTVRLDDEDTLNRLTYSKVVSINKLKYNNRLSRLKMIGRI